MAQLAYTLTPKKIRVVRGITTEGFATIIPNLELLGETVQRISAVEIMKEVKKGNQPQNLIVDNRKSKPFNKADFRVVALFGDPRAIANATVNVLRELRNYTRKKSGTAKGSYELWKVDHAKDPGKMLYSNATNLSVSIIEKWAASLPPFGKLVIVGPMTDYGRKLYWNPLGKTPDYKYEGRARYRIGYDEVGRLSRINAKYISGERSKKKTNMRDLVVGKVRSRHPTVTIMGRWVRDLVINDDAWWPGISIGIKSKGRL